MKIVTCLGDSETWCLNLARADSWPYRLCVALDGGGTPSLDTLSPWSGRLSSTGAQRQHVGTNWTVRNAGVSSDTSRGGRAAFATDVLGASPLTNFLLIMYGENDIYYASPVNGGNDPTYGLDYTPGGLIDNIEWMVSQCVANGIVPILCTPTPHGTLEQETNNRWPRMQDLLKWLGTDMTWMSTSHAARSPALPLVDVYKATYDSAHPAYPLSYPSGSPNSIDNIHPSATGSQIIGTLAAAVVAAITPPAVVLDSDAVWSLAGSNVTVNHAPSGMRSAVRATVRSAGGGLVRFAGADASRFSVSADGITYGATRTVPPGPSVVYLGVTPQAGDTTLSAQLGVPL